MSNVFQTFIISFYLEIVMNGNWEVSHIEGTHIDRGHPESVRWRAKGREGQIL